MKNSIKRIITLILALSLVFSISATTVVYALDGEGSGSSSSSSSSGNIEEIVTGWCDISYDENGVVVTLTPDREAILGVTEEQLRSILNLVINAVKTLVVDDIKNQIIDSNAPDYDQSEDASGVNADNLWMMAINGYINQNPTKYPDGAEESYVLFLQNAIRDDSNAVIGDFIDFACRLIESALAVGVITPDELPEPEDIENKIVTIFNEKVQEFIDVEIPKHTSEYLDWLENGVAPSNPSIQAIITDQLKVYVEDAVKAYIKNGFLPEAGDVVSTAISDYLNMEIKDTVDVYIRNYANNELDKNPDRVNTFIKDYFDECIAEILENWPTAVDNPVYKFAHDKIETAVKDKITSYISLYFTDSLYNEELKSSITAEIKLHAPDYIPGLYWEYRDLDESEKPAWVKTIDTELEKAIKNEIEKTIRSEVENNKQQYIDEYLEENKASIMSEYKEQIKTELEEDIKTDYEYKENIKTDYKYDIKAEYSDDIKAELEPEYRDEYIRDFEAESGLSYSDLTGDDLISFDNELKASFEEWFSENYDQLFEDNYEEFFDKKYEELFDEYYNKFFDQKYNDLFDEYIKSDEGKAKIAEKFDEKFPEMLPDLVDEAYASLTTEDVKNEIEESEELSEKFRNEIKKVVDAEEDFTAYGDVWAAIEPAKKDIIIDTVIATLAGSETVLDIIEEYCDVEFLQDALLKLIASADYDATLDDIIASAKSNATVKELLEEEINDRIADVDTIISTFRSAIAKIKEKDIDTYNDLIAKVREKVKTESEKPDALEQAYLSYFGIGSQAVKDRVVDFVELLLVDYKVVYDKANSETEAPKLTPELLLSYLTYVSITENGVEYKFYDEGKVNSDAIRDFIAELPTLTKLANMADEDMKIDWSFTIATIFGECDFDLTVILGGGHDYVRRLASFISSHVDLSFVNGHLELKVNVPYKFAELVVRAAKSERIPDSVKNKVFAALSKSPDDAYALFNELTFDEILILIDNLPIEKVLDSEYVSRFEKLDGLTKEEIIDKIAEYESYYKTLCNYIVSVYETYVPDHIKDNTVTDYYNGNGSFDIGGAYTFDLRKILTKISEKYGAMIANFLDRETVSLSAHVEVVFEGINRVEYRVGNTTRVGFLPKGADLTYFAGVSYVDGYLITAWRDVSTGKTYTKMPDLDVVLEPVYTVPLAYIVSVTGEKLDTVTLDYDGEGIKLTAVVEYDFTNPAFSYQWYLDGEKIDGATSQFYTVKNVSESGEYYCVVSVKDGKINDSYESSHVTVTINPIAVSGLEGVEWDYSGTPFAYDSQNKTVAIKGETLPEFVEVLLYTDNVKSEAGKYTATATFKSTSENYYIPEGFETSVEWEIAASVLNLDNLKWAFENGVSFVYNGNEQGVYLESVGNVTFTYEFAKATNAGTYVAKVTGYVNNDENYTHVIGSLDNVPTLSWSITAKYIDLSSFDWDYEGKTFVFDGETEHTVLLKDLGEFAPYVVYENNTSVNAGTFTASASISSEFTGTLLDNNYDFGESCFKTLTWSVGKRVIDISALTWDYTEGAFTYNYGEEFTVSLKDVGDLSFVYQNNKASVAGKYTATATLADKYNSGDYEIKNGLKTLSLDWEIAKLTVSVGNLSWYREGGALYDGTLHSVYLVDADGNKVPGISYTGNAYTVPGTYTATAIFDDPSCIYEGQFTTEYTWSIEKGVFDISGLKFPSKIVNYDGKEHSVNIVGLEEFLLRYPGTTCTMTPESVKEIGTYEIVLVFTNEYYNPVTLTALIQIRPALTTNKEFTVEGTEGDVIVKVTGQNGLTSDHVLEFIDVSDSYDMTVEIPEDVLGEGLKGTLLSVYDIHFKQNGNEKPVTDKFTVELLIPASLLSVKESLRVVYIDEQGGFEDMDAVVKGNYLVFETTHFSLYAIVEAAGEGDGFPWFIIAIILIIAALVIVLLIIFRKPKDGDNEPDALAAEQPASDNGGDAEEAPVEEAREPETNAETVISGDVEIPVRYRHSFMSRLIQAEPPIQDYYTEVKNALMSYKGVKARTSWNFESFNKGREQCAKLNVKGKNFLVYLNLNPSEYNVKKYHFQDVTGKPKVDDVPMLLKVKSERGLKYAIELIHEMMTKFGFERYDAEVVDYHMPFEATEELAKRDLVKIILPKGVKLDENANVVRLDVGELLDADKKADGKIVVSVTDETEITVSEEVAADVDPVIEETDTLPVEEVTVEESKEPEIKSEIIVSGDVEISVRYRHSFMSRLIQAEPPVQDYYTEVKNALMSYKGVKARTSWNFESFNKGREQCAKLNVKGKNFLVYLNLNPSEYNVKKYHFQDVTDKPKVGDVPMLLKVKSERGLKYAIELIHEMMAKFGFERYDAEAVDYHMPFESTEELAKRDLVKIILPKGVKLDKNATVIKLDAAKRGDRA